MSGKKRGTCVFNPELAKKYPFIKIDKAKSRSDVRCDICGSEFNIGNAGRTDIDKHINGKKHEAKLRSTSSSQLMTKFVSRTDYSIAACEGVWAYHTIKSNHSFLSSDCSSNIFRTCFGMTDYHCARTKCEAIVVGVLAPHAAEVLVTELTNARYVTLSCDASNHGETKMMPVAARYFNPIVGVRVKMLEFSSVNGETSEIIENLIKTTAEKNCIVNKVVGFCGDNCSTNFGSRERGGENNVFYRLKEWIRHLIGIGCGAHVTHNGLKFACEFLPIDIEYIVVKIYSHFYIYTVRVAALKEICDEAELEYSKLLGYSNTRFLALGRTIGKILKMFEPLKQYFLGLEKCPPLITSFFTSHMSKLLLMFVKEQADLFQETILKIEGDKISAFEVSYYLDLLKGDLVLRREEKYLDPTTEEEKKKLIENGLCNEALVNGIFQRFFDDALHYISKWSEQFELFDKFSWIDLRKSPDWTTVKQSFTVLEENTSFDMTTHSSAVFQQYGYIKKFVTEDKIAQWKKEKILTEARWVEIFNHMNDNHVPFDQFAHAIEYILCLPGTSAPVERLFAEVNKIWKRESTALKISTLKAMLTVKSNMEYDCIEFYTFLKTQPALLRKIGSQEKYDFKQSKAVDVSASAMSIDIDSDK